MGGILDIIVCRILMLMWSFGALLVLVPGNLLGESSASERFGLEISHLHAEMGFLSPTFSLARLTCVSVYIYTCIYTHMYMYIYIYICIDRYIQIWMLTGLTGAAHVRAQESGVELTQGFFCSHTPGTALWTHIKKS